MENISLINDSIFFPSNDGSSRAVALAEDSSAPANDTISDSGDSNDGKLLSDLTCYLFEVIVYTFLCGAVSITGIITNTINLLVFKRQGMMNDSVTVTLSGLATADLCCLITMLWLSICYAILISKPANLTWDPLSVLYITGGWPHVMFTRVTCWITAFVALERCLCVVLPFKVKNIVTPARALCGVICIFVFIILCYFPIFYTHRLQWTFNPSTNATILALAFTENKPEVERICHFINDVIFPTISLAIVMVCTKITVSRINSASEWRSNLKSALPVRTVDKETTVPTVCGDMSSSADELVDRTIAKSENSNVVYKRNENLENNLSRTPSKEKKVIRMVTLICTIFIICNTPCILIIYLRFAVPEIANLGRYHNLFHVLYSLDFLLESINSTINILVYYRMSSRYKAEFRALFGLSAE